VSAVNLRRSKPGPCTLRADTSRHRLPGLQPGLRHGAFDNVPLNSFALWASKSSQDLAGTARLNRLQSHWRTASRALWALILFVEHGTLAALGDLARLLNPLQPPLSTMGVFAGRGLSNSPGKSTLSSFRPSLLHGRWRDWCQAAALSCGHCQCRMTKAPCPES
jgi:hypothetical protein